ncbi:MAG: helix-turn-helix domain-containing protein [Pseudonocardiaceae bacterium]|nr:helix-turn-helix domain-containing protein [Pseudonocardiaceae bacterium]
MVRPPLSQRELDRGARLGRLLRDARAERPTAEVAAAAGISMETLRKIEHGRIATPAFFTVVAIAEAIQLPVPELCRQLEPSSEP